MAIDVNYVLEGLSTRQIESGGYYGTDIAELSKELGVRPQGLRKQISGVEEKHKRFLEGCKARVESHNVDLSLIASELVISVAGLYHTLNGWSGPESPFNLSDIRPCLRIREMFLLLVLYRHNLYTYLLSSSAQ